MKLPCNKVSALTRIGLLSDTHGYLDPRIFEHFDLCDEIWHAGDFGNLTLANKLNDFKPLRGVYGNIDGNDVRAVYPEINRFVCENVEVLMIHIGGYPKKYTPLVKTEFKARSPQLFISGHSHILKVIYDDQFQCLHMNPGAAGKQGWQKVRTLIRFTIDGSNMKDCEVVELL